MERAAEQVKNFLKAFINEMCTFAQLAGKSKLRNLEKEDLRALTWRASLMTGVKIMGVERSAWELLGREAYEIPRDE